MAGDLSNIELLHSPLGRPQHRIPIEVSEDRSPAFNVKRLSGDQPGTRDVLLLEKWSQIGPLDSHARALARRFTRFVEKRIRDCGLGAVATVKDLERRWRQGDAVFPCPTITIAHRYGAVPAVYLGDVQDYKVVFFPAGMGRTKCRKDLRAKAREILLESYCEYLPHLATGYAEQAANYLDSVLFGSAGHRESECCRRVREFLSGSIRGKTREIRDCQEGDGPAAVWRRQIMAEHGDTVTIMQTLDAFGHLLVNYIYRFRCIVDRVDEYERRLMKIPGRERPLEWDPVSFMKKCARHIRQPFDEFLHYLQRLRQAKSTPRWLLRFGEISAFLAEVNRSAQQYPPDRAKIFATHHFRVTDSEDGVKAITASAQSGTPEANIMVGRHIVDRDIRWTVLANLWYSDVQLLMVPESWGVKGGGAKRHRKEGNWVVIELQFGTLLGRELVIATTSDECASAVADMRTILSDHQDPQSLRPLPWDGWSEFASKANAQLAEKLDTNRHLSLASARDEHVRRYLIDQGAREAIRRVRRHWQYMFTAAQWAVAQVLIETDAAVDPAGLSMDQVHAAMRREQAHKREHLGWLKDEDSRSSQINRIRRTLLGLSRIDSSQQDEHVDICFNFGGNRVVPIRMWKLRGRWRVQVDLADIVERVHAAFGVPATANDVEEWRGSLCGH